MDLVAEPVVAGVVALGGALVALTGWRACLWWRELERELQALAARVDAFQGSATGRQVTQD